MAQGKSAVAEPATALARQGAALDLAGVKIETPAQLAERVRELQSRAFILSPMTAVAAIAPGYTIVPVVVAIDPSVDAKSGRGADVYHQRSIHKGSGRGSDYEPVEVSLNHYALLRLLSSAGVNVHETRWAQDGVREPYLWVAETDGDIIDFTGQVLRLPTGIGSLDARDGSADIGEWTPAKWAEAVRVAEAQKARTPPDEQWKVKPEVNGWTLERVLQVRKFGRQLVKTKSLNGLARKLGVRQTYTIAELQVKPFVILRPMFQPDLSDPVVRQMVTAAHLGARNLLYGGASPASVVPVSHAHGEAWQTLEGAVVVPADLVEPEPVERMRTAGAPEGATELRLEEPPAKAAAPDDTYIVARVLQQQGDGGAVRYFIETREGVTLYTPDLAVAKACLAAVKDGQPRRIQTERVLVGGQPYRQVIELALPDGGY